MCRGAGFFFKQKDLFQFVTVVGPFVTVGVYGHKRSHNGHKRSQTNFQAKLTVTTVTKKYKELEGSSFLNKFVTVVTVVTVGFPSKKTFFQFVTVA